MFKGKSTGNPYISWGKPWFPLIYATKFEKNNKKI
jgi:hypothetical protein